MEWKKILEEPNKKKGLWYGVSVVALIYIFVSPFLQQRLSSWITPEIFSAITACATAILGAAVLNIVYYGNEMRAITRIRKLSYNELVEDVFSYLDSFNGVRKEDENIRVELWDKNDEEFYEIRYRYEYTTRLKGYGFGCCIIRTSPEKRSGAVLSVGDEKGYYYETVLYNDETVLPGVTDTDYRIEEAEIDGTPVDTKFIIFDAKDYADARISLFSVSVPKEMKFNVRDTHRIRYTLCKPVPKEYGDCCYIDVPTKGASVIFDHSRVDCKVNFWCPASINRVIWKNDQERKEQEFITKDWLMPGTVFLFNWWKERK